MEDIEKLVESLSCMGVIEGRAAAALTSLLAENERIRSNCYPRDGVEAIIRERDAYRAQLAESQRRERAAVEDLLKDSHCTLCKHHLSEGGDCYGVSKCAVNGLRVGWEWRGPVAGKGDTK